MSMKPILVLAWSALLALAYACTQDDPCYPFDKDKWDCTCTATCPANGQQVSSHTGNLCGESDNAKASAMAACQRELSACGTVSCSCSCTNVGECETTSTGCH